MIKFIHGAHAKSVAIEVNRAPSATQPTPIDINYALNHYVNKAKSSKTMCNNKKLNQAPSSYIKQNQTNSS